MDTRAQAEQQDAGRGTTVMLVAADSDGALARRIATVRRAVQHAAAPKGSSHPAAKRLLGVLARQVALARGRAAIGAVVATVAARGRLQRTRRRGGRRRDHWHSAAPAPRGQVNSLAVARLAGGGSRLQQALRLAAARALRAELARRCSRCHRKHGDSRPPRNAHGKGAGLVCLCWWLEKAVGSRAGAAAALPPPAARAARQRLAVAPRCQWVTNKTRKITAIQARISSAQEIILSANP